MKKLFIPVLLAVMVFAASAFTAQRHAAAKAAQIDYTWYFTGDDIDQANQKEHWSLDNPQLGCGSGNDLPCRMVVADAPDENALGTFLSGKTDEQIRDVYANAKRAE